MQQAMTAVERGKSVLIHTAPGLGLLHRLREALSKRSGVVWVGAAVTDDFDWHTLARTARFPEVSVVVVYDLESIHPSAVDLLALISGVKPVIGVTMHAGPSYFFEKQLHWPAPTPEEWMTEMKRG